MRAKGGGQRTRSELDRAGLFAAAAPREEGGEGAVEVAAVDRHVDVVAAHQSVNRLRERLRPASQSSDG